MYDAEVLHVPEGREQLYREPSDEAVLEALVIVHLYELVQVDAVQVEDAAEVVSEDEVVPELDHSLNVVGVALLEEEKKFGLDGGLIIIFFLVFNELDGDQLFVLVVQALDDLSKGTLADDLNQLEPEGYVVSFLYTIIAFLVVEAIVDKPLHIARLNLELVLAKVVELVVLIDLCGLELGEVLLLYLFGFGLCGLNGKVDVQVRSVIDRQLISFGGFGYH